MKIIEFHLFKKNTEAIATNKGFYYQYLKTVKLWLDNFINGVDNAIYCEREDDIMQVDKKTNQYTFHQIKCYSTKAGLNDKEIKFSLLNFYMLYLKYDYRGKFYFETNSDFKPQAGKTLKKWYENQQKGDYSVSDFINEVRKNLIELADEDLKKRLKKATTNTEKKELKESVEKFKLQLKEPHFKTFLESIRWTFAKEQNTDIAISDLQKEIQEIILSDLEYDKTVDRKFLFAYILNSVVEKSIKTDEEKRLLDNELLQNILNLTDIQEKITERLRPEIMELMKNDFEIIEKLDDMHKDVKEIKEHLLGNKNKSPIDKLTDQVKKWFNVVGYSLEKDENIFENSSELIIDIPKRRRGYDRVFVLCVAEVIELPHLDKLLKRVEEQKCDEGWVVTYSRVSNSVREKAGKIEKYKDTLCFTFDKLIDEDIDFSDYFKWVEDEVKSKEIDSKYISLFCQKRVFDENHHRAIDSSKYQIEEYIDQWIDDPSKHHISILGEFGTGKTWFTLHYTWLKLQEYKKAKKRGIERPRIPVFIPLRDFAKAVNIEGVFSEFFFRKHNSPIRNYDTFVELNKMGKLLLIFDGFDEMADRVDTQKMINNFWELARAITENSKVILTSRNEHFPENKKGRELLNAELQASTQHLVDETPQFEVLELVKFNEEQIKKLLGFYTDKKTIKKIMDNQDVMELASRPVMIELILEALQDIEDDKPIDISRIYLYSIRSKFQKDIKEERTFTSISDKLYFMCELSWEMLSTDNMSINYRLFPDRIRNLFGGVVTEEKDIDHWQYDMMGQTMLIRNDDGDYKPAHRSLLEFFVAYKFAGELGVLDNDFVELAFSNSNEKADDYCWEYYFKNASKIKLSKFKRLNLVELKETFGKQVITRAIIDLISNMISIDSEETQYVFNQIIEECRYKEFKDVGYIVTNLVILLTNYQNDYFMGKDLSNLSINGLELPNSRERRPYRRYKIPNFNQTNFENSDLTKSCFNKSIFSNRINISKSNFKNAILNEFKFNIIPFDSVDILLDKGIIAISSYDEIKILNIKNLEIQKRIKVPPSDKILFSPNEKYLVHSDSNSLFIRDTEKFEIIIEHKLSKEIANFTFSKNSEIIYIRYSKSQTSMYDIKNGQEINVIPSVEEYPNNISLSFDENNIPNYKVIFHPTKNIAIIVNKQRIELFDIEKNHFVSKFEIGIEIDNMSISYNGEIIYGSKDNMIFAISIKKKKIIEEYIIDFSKKISGYSRDDIREFILNEENNILYIIGWRELIVFNLKSKKVIDRYVDLGDMRGTVFTGAKGIDEDVLIQIERNGGIV